MSADGASKGQVHMKTEMSPGFPNMACSVLLERDTPSGKPSGTLKVSSSFCNNILSNFQTFSALQGSFQLP